MLRFPFSKLMLLLSILASPSCTTSHQPSVFSKFEDLEVSRSFSSQTISTRRFTLHFADLDPAFGLSLEAAEDLFVQGFEAARFDLRALKVPTSQKLRTILKAFHGIQEFPADGYALLSQSETQQSWFVIADMESNHSSQNVKEEELKNDKGEHLGRKYSFISERRVGVRYFIYDPIEKALVFSGLIHSSTRVQNDRVTSDSDASDFWNALSGKASGAEDSPYPEYPSFAKTLAQNIEQFSRNLPQSQGQ